MNRTKLQETKDLLYEHSKEITQDAAHWMDFLDTASRVYRYSFPDLVLIHAQRPDASAVAAYDIWSQNMHRYIRRGSKGIALLDDLSDRPRLRYVFDISDTGIMRGSRSPGYWQIADDMQDDVRDHLIETYGLDAERVPNLMTALIHICFDVCDNYYQEIAETVKDRLLQLISDDSFEKPEENEISSHVGMLLTNSMVYILASRCGLDPASVVSAEDFDRWLIGFQNFDLIDAVGQVIMEQASQILHDIYRTTVKLSREKKKTALDKTIKKSYSTDNKTFKQKAAQRASTPLTASSQPAGDAVEAEDEHQNQKQKQGGQNHGDSVHSEGRLSLSEPDSDGGAGRAGGTREVRRDAPEVSEGESLRGVPQHVVPGSPETALRPDRRAGLGEAGNPGAGTDETLSGSGAGSGQRYSGIRGVEEHDHAYVGGEYPGGIGIHAVENSEKDGEEDETEIPEVPEETPPGLTLPELPPMEEQIRKLKELKTSPYARYQRNHFLIHDYFIAKSLDLVRPGGVVAVITTSGTMDKKDSSVREYIANRADLLGAIRLPNNTFTKNAGTKVVSDILFLQKRDRTAVEMPFWVKNTDGRRSLYFRFYPEMVLGRVETVSGRFGMEETVLPFEDEDLETSLNRTIDRMEGTIPEMDVDETIRLEGVNGDGLSLPATPEVRNFSFTVVKDTVYYRENSWMNRVDLAPKMKERVKGLIGLSNLVRVLLRAQMDGLPDDRIAEMQRNLDRQYDAFVELFGRIALEISFLIINFQRT